MSRRPVGWVGAVTIAAALGGCGDGGDGDDGEGGTGGAPSPPPTVEASGCDIPPPPDLGALAEHVVGDGTPESCTASALEAALAEAGRITFDCGSAPVTVPVTRTLLVGDATHLVGGGLVTLDGGDEVAILRTASTSTVILEGLTFTRGHARKVAGDEEADGSGGAVKRGWQSDLYVEDCVFSDNVADGDDGFTGGAIFAGSAGWLTLVGCTFTGNRAPSGGATHTVLSNLTVVDTVFAANEATSGDGGAVYTDGGYVPYGGENGAHDGKLSFCGCRFTDNVAAASAAAGFLYAYGADQLVLNRTELRNNRVTTAEPGLGGALRIDAVAYVYNTLFAENTCAGQGGALWVGRGPVTFENVTFFANHASLWGGAVSYDKQLVTFNNSTLAYNVADAGSDCLFGGEESTPIAHNTLFFQNGTDGDGRHCRRPITATNSIAFPATDTDTCGAGLSHADPGLAAELADAGGFTETLALGAASPALDVGSDCPTTDQRGEPRDTAHCDLGAFELP